jgi:hypothetical protein
MTVNTENKPLLRIGFVDCFDGVADFFTAIFSNMYTVIRDDENPDYLIFCDETFGIENLKYNDKKCIKIFYTGENRRHTNYACHYGITFDHSDDSRQYRLPLYTLNLFYLQTRLNLDLIETVNKRMGSEPPAGRDFCGFVASNPNCVKRNGFFHQLSEYKRVDSAGPLFNNVGHVLPRDAEGVLRKMEFLSKKKFTICFENGSYPGYVTEKILEAYLAGTVPIYWGSPTVDMDFNPDAFINWHAYNSDKVFMEVIKHIDNNDEDYRLMYQAPFFRNEINSPMNIQNFIWWFHSEVYKGVLNG